MTTIRLLKGGNLSLPRDLLDSHGWRSGAEFVLEDRPEGLLLRPLHERRKPSRETAAGHGASGDGTGGRDRALADAMRDRYARLGH